MGKFDGASSTAGGVLSGNIGTALVAGDVAIGAGWGATGTKAITAGANSQRGQIVVTAAGGSYAQATATIVITFPDPYTTAPNVALVTMSNAVALDTGHATWTCTTTALTITYLVLPAAGVYTFNYALVI